VNEEPMTERAAPGASIPARCVRCGYATAGLVGTTCPECAFDLTTTPFLRYADRAWLRAIVVGTELISVGALGLLITNFGGKTILKVIARTLGMPFLNDPLALRGFLALFLLSCGVGAWLLSAPDPALAALDDERQRRRSLERAGIAATLVVGAARIACEGLLPPPVCAVMTVVAMSFGLYLAVSLKSTVRELLSRAEAKEAEESATQPTLPKVKKGADSTSWVIWVIVAIVLIGVWSASGGVATAAIKIERTLLGLGTIITGFALLELVKGAKAIHAELAKAAPEA
jgi:hypothetical protein